jgi:hypothetical protein
VALYLRENVRVAPPLKARLVLSLIRAKDRVKDADATEFWNLTPAAVKSEIVMFPAPIAA